MDRHLNVFVSDFGFARQKSSLGSKGFTKNNMGPVKWEAPESLQHKEYRLMLCCVACPRLVMEGGKGGDGRALVNGLTWKDGHAHANGHPQYPPHWA